MSNKKKWWESKGIWGSVAVVIGTVATMLGYDIGSTEGWANLLMQLIGGVLAFYGRIKAVKKIG